MANVKKIGLLVGREWSFPPAFIEEVNGRDAGVIAEYAKLGGTRVDEPVEYSVIVDRVSHAVPFYQAYLKNAVLQGAYVINNPFLCSADDAFFEASLAHASGVPTPRTVALPMKGYLEGVDRESLRNLIYPLDWADILAHVGQPAILKNIRGGGQRVQQIVHSVDELIHAYDGTGEQCMVVQEFIEWDQLVRCLCVGQQQIMPLMYDPEKERYEAAEEHLSVELMERLLDHTRTLNRALGFDMNSIEFAIREGKPYAIDFINNAPDMDINSLTPRHFEWAVKTMADFCLEMAANPHEQRTQPYGARTLSDE